MRMLGVPDPLHRVHARGVDLIQATREYRVRIRTNSAGFRGSELPRTKPEGSWRVLLPGDSFTMGYGVDEESTYAWVAMRFLDHDRRVFDRTEALNLGVGGTGPLEYADVLARWGPRLRPDAVVVGLCRENDLNDSRNALERERGVARAHLRLVYIVRDLLWRLRHSPRGIPEPGGWRRRGGVANPLDEEELARDARARGLSEDSLRARLRRLPSGLLQSGRRWEVNPFLIQSGLLAPQALRRTLLGQGPEAEEALAATREGLARIRSVAARLGCPVVLMLIPASVEVSRAAWPPFLTMGYTLDDSLLAGRGTAVELAATAESLGFRLLDLLPAFRAAGREPLYYRWDDHWNTRGHALAGTRLATVLDSLRASPRPR